LGSEAFVERVQAHIATQLTNPEQPANARQEVPLAQRKPANPPERALKSYASDYPDARDSAIRAAHASGHHSMAAIAQQFGVRYTTVSRIVNEVGRYKSTTQSSRNTNATPVRAAKLMSNLAGRAAENRQDK
jgi:transposase-like protein